MNKRFLIFLAEYGGGGAQTQLIYIINYALKNGIHLDVIVEHVLVWEINSHEAKEKLSVDENKSDLVRFFDWNEKNASPDCLNRDIYTFLKNETMNTDYLACLMFYEWDLVRVKTIRAFGIPVMYSERVMTSEIFKYPDREEGLYQCDCITSNSMYAKQVLESTTHRRVECINNGKECMPLLEEKNVWEGNILVPARITPHKNLDVVLDWLIRYTNCEWNIRFVGEVDDRAYRNRLWKRIIRNGLTNNVEILGHVDDMRKMYEWADLVVLPSLREGTPNVVLEAFMLGRPVVVSDIEPERYLVTNNKLRFSPDSSKQLNDCILTVKNMNEKSYSYMLKHNRQYVLKNFNIEHMAERYFEILRKLPTIAKDEQKKQLYEIDEELSKLSKIQEDNSVEHRKNARQQIIIDALSQWLWLRQIGRSLWEFFENEDIHSIAVYGMGVLGERLCDELHDTSIKVVYGIDKRADILDSELGIFTAVQGSIDIDAIVITSATQYLNIREKISAMYGQTIRTIWLIDILYDNYWYK